MRPYAFLAAVFLILGLGACASGVPIVEYRETLNIPQDASPAPVKFNGVELLLPVGTEMGYEGTGGTHACGWPRYPVSRSALRDAIDEKFIRQTFHDALSAQGYDIVGNLNIAFEEEEEIERAEYSVSAKVSSVQLEMCHNEPHAIFFFFAARPGINGQFYMTVDWTVYDALHRKVAYKTTTEGYTNHRTPNQEGMALLFSDAFEMAAHNLGADPQFRGLIVNGEQPDGWQKEKWREERFKNRPSKYDPLEEVSISNPPLSVVPFSRTADQGRRAAVMPEKFGHGSGFFITKEGHILTNAHVVGDAQRIRVVTADRKEKLVAEVLRVDKMRDVALLKLEEIPEGFEITTLPIRAQWPAVGEDVYTIGAPQNSRKLQDTVTKGIVSAHRNGMRFMGTRQNFIQSDVELHGGNSGGPLLDANGNITGMAVGGLTDEGTGLGLNYFIPIGEALDRLDIHLSGGSATKEPQKITAQ